MITEKDQIDCYLELYKAKRQCFAQRQNYEWKISLGLWGAVIILAGKAIEKGAFDTKLSGLWFVSIHIAIFLVYIFSWSRGLHASHDRDRETAIAYEEALREFVTSSDSSPRIGEVKTAERKVFAPLLNWSAIAQILITAGIFSLNLVVFWPNLYWPECIK